MTHDEWMVLVMTSHKGLYKKGYIGREVYDFEIDAALDIQRVFARYAGTGTVRVTKLIFTTPPDGSTYRSMTEACHSRISEEPDLMESAWINVWHTVAEASFLAHHAEAIRQDMADTAHDIGFAAYLAYCRECRDWTPDPPQYDNLPVRQRAAWGVAQTVGARKMAEGFRAMEVKK